MALLRAIRTVAYSEQMYKQYAITRARAADANPTLTVEPGKTANLCSLGRFRLHLQRLVQNKCSCKCKCCVTAPYNISPRKTRNVHRTHKKQKNYTSPRYMDDVGCIVVIYFDKGICVLIHIPIGTVKYSRCRSRETTTCEYMSMVVCAGTFECVGNRY